jgi:hypothetical protein
MRARKRFGKPTGITDVITDAREKRTCARWWGAQLFVVGAVLLGVLACASNSVASGAPPRFVGCDGIGPQIRPRLILIACGDGNFYISKLRWQSWSRSGALGVGLAYRNDCRPNCARGRFHSYSISIRLSQPVICLGVQRVFTRVTYSFLSVTPVGSRRTVSLQAPFYQHSGCH